MQYQPDSIPLERWVDVRDRFIDVMFRLRLNAAQVRSCKAIVAQLLVWADDQLIAPDYEAVFALDTIEQFVAECVQAPSESTIRSRLRRLGEQLTVDGGYGGRPPALARAHLQAPYPQVHLDLLHADASHQPSADLNHLFEAVLAVGLGLGTSSGDAKTLRGTDSLHTSEALVVFLGAERREVPVPARYAAFLTQVFTAAGPDYVLPGRDTNSKVSNLISRFHLGETTPPLRMARLRNTWLVRLIESGVPLPDILKIAGLRTVDTIRDLLPYCRTSELGVIRQQVASMDAP